jgi:hypothetical protein
MKSGFCDTRDNKTLKTYITAYKATDNPINLCLMLAYQQFGGGQAVASHIGGILSIVENAFQNTWMNIEETIGKYQIQLGKTFLGENIERGKNLSKQDNKGRYLFCVSINAGWNNHRSGKAYNSPTLADHNHRCNQCMAGKCYMQPSNA